MPKGMISYDAALDTIKGGGSIVYKSYIIDNVAAMPTRLQYAEGDDDEVAAVLADMKAQQAEQAKAIEAAEKKDKK